MDLKAVPGMIIDRVRGLFRKKGVSDASFDASEADASFDASEADAGPGISARDEFSLDDMPAAGSRAAASGGKKGKGTAGSSIAPAHKIRKPPLVKIDFQGIARKPAFIIGASIFGGFLVSVITVAIWVSRPVGGEVSAEDAGIGITKTEKKAKGAAPSGRNRDLLGLFRYPAALLPHEGVQLEREPGQGLTPAECEHKFVKPEAADIQELEDRAASFADSILEGVQ